MGMRLAFIEDTWEIQAGARTAPASLRIVVACCALWGSWNEREGLSMGQALAVIGAIIIIAALAIHFVIKGLTLFPHASLTIGIVGAIVAAIGAFMLMPRSAK
jgi:peptidoglycan/LPS O-acetylase OafA/YrhL